MSQKSFWASQPVKHTDNNNNNNDSKDNIGETGEISYQEPSQDSIALPRPFQYAEINFQTEGSVEEVAELLKENYVEDNDATLRFNYSKQFLEWALQFDKEVNFCFGLRLQLNKRLVGFISGKRITIQVKGSEIKCIEVNFLCLHKSLRQYRLAPILIQEITRRANLQGVQQAVFTTGFKLPFQPLSIAPYWHREINPRRLLASGFSQIPPSFRRFSNPVKLLERRYKIEEESCLDLVSLEENDLDGVVKLLEKWGRGLEVSPIFTREEVRQLFLPREDVVKSFVVRKGGKGEGEGSEVVAFASYFLIDMSVLDNKKISSLKVAQLFYGYSQDGEAKRLVESLFPFMKRDGADVVTFVYTGAFAIRKEELEELRFGPGNGSLYYYLYNWKTSPVSSKEIGMVTV